MHYKQLFFQLVLLVGLPFTLVAQELVKGSVIDALSNEPLIGASVYFQSTQKGTTTDINGKFELKAAPGSYRLIVSFLGYGADTLDLLLPQQDELLIELQPKAIQKQEVVVSAEREDKNIEAAQMGKIELEMKEIERLPAFLGEVDILKTIQLLPGIQAAGDGNSGFYVRGGGPDQNLILFDGATLYNASHLFGFFSVFNSDYIEEVDLTKGGMPAEYGGRLASVLDITSRTGDMQEFHGKGGIGLISSRLSLEGPIKKNRSSFLVSGRRTYIDVVIQPFVPEDNEFANSGYYFYDLNGKVSFRLKDNSLLEINGYLGRDVFNLDGGSDGFGSGLTWGNNILGAKWSKAFNNKFSGKVSAYYTEYDFTFSASQSDFELELFSGIRDIQTRADFSWIAHPRHQLKFGATATAHEFTPSNVSARSGETEVSATAIRNMNAIESAVYLQDEFDVTDALKVNAGIRFSNFIQYGPFTRYSNEGFNRSDTTEYGSGEQVVSYSGWEPRLTLRYKTSLNGAVKAAFTRNYQYVHLANFSTLALPTDLWLPSSDKVVPQTSNQFALGYFHNFKSNTYEASVEAYYRTMNNLVEYEEGALPADDINTNPDNSLVQGIGWSYGVELFIKKRYGDLTGWIGYTWSKTMRQVELINGGNAYPAPYDRRHDLSIVGSYQLNEKWTFSGTFVYGTGNAITLPTSRYIYEGRIVNDFGERNSYRLPAYHRLDLAATMQGKKRKRWESSWVFAIYNVYSRMNPFFIYMANEGQVNEGTLNVEAKQVSLFPILPSVTYNFNF